MKRRLRIAVVAACPFPAPRGTPIRIYRLADEISRRGHDVQVFTYHLGAAAFAAPFPVHRIANVKTYRKESPGPTYQKLLLLDPLLALKLARALRRGRFDVIHAHHVEGLLAALPATRLYRVPLVFDAHTLLETELPYYRMGFSRRVLRRLGAAIDARVPRHADHVIAVSEEIRAAVTHKARIADHDVSVIPNGIEDAFFAPVSRVRTTPRSPTWVYAGNLGEFQDIPLLLRTFAAGRRQCAELKLALLTDSSFDEYEPLARELGIRDAIEIAAVPVADLPAALARADVAINPRVECSGLPQKLLNYMAVGCAIASFAGSAKHVAHERTALVVQGDDVEALAAAALRLVADRRLAARLGTAARAFARAELGWPRAAARVEAVYEALASAHEARP